MSRVGNGEVQIGSAAHRDLFCRSFIDTHLPYEPHALPWPELDAPSLDRLRALPFWDEAVVRHILFFANWVAYRRARRLPIARPIHRLRCTGAFAVALGDRLRTARGASRGGFTMKGHEAISAAIRPRQFLALCLAENERRLAPYDPRLLRPRLTPALAGLALTVLR